MSKNNNFQLPRAVSNIDVMSVGYITLNNADQDVVGGDMEDEYMDDIQMEDQDIEDEGTDDEYIEDEDTDYEDDDENMEDEPSRARTQEPPQMNTPEGNNTHTSTTEASSTSEGRRSCRLMAGLSSTPTAGSSNSENSTNAPNSIYFKSEKDDAYYKMIKELTTKKKIIRRIRLPVHPSACIVCRLCLICSHVSLIHV